MHIYTYLYIHQYILYTGPADRARAAGGGGREGKAAYVNAYVSACIYPYVYM